MSESASQALSTRGLPPRVSGYPLVGCLPGLARDPLRFMKDAQQLYGDIFTMDLGFTQAIGLCHPQHAQRILVDCAQKYSKGGPMWDSMRTFMGNALPMSEGTFWKRQRRMIQPAFHHQRVATMAATMVTAIDECLSEWDLAALEERPLEVSGALSRVTMNVLVRCLFGSAMRKEDAEKVAEAFSFILDYFVTGMMTHSLPEWLPVPGRARYRASIQLIDEVLSDLIARGRESSQEEDNLLSMLLQAVDGESGEQMTHAQLRDETLGFFIAGYDTTAAGMAWVLHALTRHPEVAERVQAELDGVVGQRKPGFPDLMRMPYTRNVVQESLRTHSPSVWLPRQSVQEDEIDGYRIPAGRMIVIFTHLIHHHPAVWEAPEHFDPDRFLPSRSEGRHKLAWLPFGSGQRQCIAKEFAIMESTLILARIASRFSLSSIPGREAVPRVSTNLRTKDGMWLNLRPRLVETQRPRIVIGDAA